MKNDALHTSPRKLHRIKCSQCGNERNKFYLVSSNIEELTDKTTSFRRSDESELSKKQRYLEHIAEAQMRFGE